MTAYYLKIHPVIRGKATVTRMDGTIIYTVRESFSMLGRTLAILDADKHIVAKIRQSISLITPKFRIALNEQTPFYLQRRFSLRPDYKITGRSWVIDGDYYRRYITHIDGNKICEIMADREVAAKAYNIIAVSDADALAGIGIALAIVATSQALRASAN